MATKFADEAGRQIPVDFEDSSVISRLLSKPAEIFRGFRGE